MLISTESLTVLKIYDYKGFPNPARIRIAVAEKGLTDKVEFISVDVPAAEHKRPEFLAKNPTGTVPLLGLEDGTYISECTAITEYLDNIAGEPVLTGQGARERAVIHMMQRRAESGLFDAIATYWHHATPGLGPVIETYQNKEWGEHNRKRAIAGMRYLDGVLATQPYLAGSRFTMPDITAYVGLGYVDFAKVEIPSDLKNLRAWRARVAERPSTAHA